MTNQKFKIGDLVKLKSGGMTMTINKDKEWNAAKGVYNYEKVHCAWFDEKIKLISNGLMLMLW